MNTMIRCYSEAQEAKRKEAMAFDLSPYDHKLLRFGELFEERFMDIKVSMGINDALDLCWKTLGECFEPQELMMKQQLVDKYLNGTKDKGADSSAAEEEA